MKKLVFGGLFLALIGIGVVGCKKENSQIHDYSNNWDIDGDKIPDKIQFWGNGGAHLAYCPLILLSSSNKVFYFDYLQIDLPIYETDESLKTKDIGFRIVDFDKDGIKDIFLNTSFKEKSSFQI
jgi:hypothetical protein